MAEDTQSSESTETRLKSTPRDATGKQGALEWFKNSHAGQILMTAFATASVTVGVTHWFYESIRIPTLSGQVAYRDDKIKSIEADLQSEREKAKASAVDLEKERFQSSGLKLALDQSATKLKQSQDDQMRLTQEMNTLKVKQIQTGGIARTNENDGHDHAGFAISLEQAVHLAGDQEDAAFLSVSRDCTELRLSAYTSFALSLNELGAKRPPTLEGLTNMLQQMGEQIGALTLFRNALDDLRAFTTKAVLAHYRTEMATFDPSEPGEFLSRIRLKPEIITKVSELALNLKNNGQTARWNLESAGSMEAFIGSTNNSPSAQAPATPALRDSAPRK